jgi:hypothetical protein
MQQKTGAGCFGSIPDSEAAYPVCRQTARLAKPACAWRDAADYFHVLCGDCLSVFGDEDFGVFDGAACKASHRAVSVAKPGSSTINAREKTDSD